ncbi:MAG TPA: hypothetical protein VMY05_10075 [Acidobacteriota bacterium]|nr:hypothetical protein [Acidobacteriota bacterium]
MDTRRQVIRAMCLVLAVTASAGCTGNASRAQTAQGAEETTVAEVLTINTNRFADLQNSSFLPVSGRITGNEVWFSPSMDTGRMRIPACLGLHGDVLVAGYGTLLVGVRRQDGPALWAHTITGNHAFMMNERGIVTLNHAGFFVLRDFEGETVEKKYLAMVTRETFLHFFAEVGEETVFCFQTYPKPVNKPGMQVELPRTAFIRYIPDHRDIRWYFERRETCLDALISRDLARVYIAVYDKLYSFPTDAASEDSVVTVEFTRIASLSVDHSGKALVVDMTEEGTELKQVAADGQIEWTVPLGTLPVSPQPPASSPDGYVYIVSGNVLHQIKDGAILWSRPLPAGPDEILYSVLADNSVLAAAGQALVHVSDRGEEIMAKMMLSPIGTRPLMDEQGRVYLGGADGIRCLQ